MKTENLINLVQYSKLPTCVHIDYVIRDKDKNGEEKRKVKKYRYKFKDFAEFLEKSQRSEFFSKTSIDEIFVQHSLLNDGEFIMIYCSRDQKDEQKDEG